MTALIAQPSSVSRAGLHEAVMDLRALAVRALGRMYRPEQGLFAFRLRRTDRGDMLEGTSKRYTASVLIALAEEPPEVAAAVLCGNDPQEVCGRLVEGIERTTDVGEAALVLWAARVLDYPSASRSYELLLNMTPAGGYCPTVELAWLLTAVAVEGRDVDVEDMAPTIADQLLSRFQDRSSLFAHGPAYKPAPSWRNHVSCFADLVYPIQALSHYHRATGDRQALSVARRCAEKMCSLQGPEGQWWWHYDVRTGRVVERYPVYSVHQDAMAPMALFALREAGGDDHFNAIEKGLRWLISPAEVPASLIDTEADLVWRKVARFEPGKLCRGVQAAASRIYSGLRIPGLDAVFPPGKVDFETRPYHMGWLLHAWPASRTSNVFPDGSNMPMAS